MQLSSELPDKRRGQTLSPLWRYDNCVDTETASDDRPVSLCRTGWTHSSSLSVCVCLCGSVSPCDVKLSHKNGRRLSVAKTEQLWWITWNRLSSFQLKDTSQPAVQIKAEKLVGTRKDFHIIVSVSLSICFAALINIWKLAADCAYRFIYAPVRPTRWATYLLVKHAL